jgi:hypothetical protein
MYLRSASNGVGKTEHTVQILILIHILILISHCPFKKANAEIYRLRKSAV